MTAQGELVLKSITTKHGGYTGKDDLYATHLLAQLYVFQKRVDV